MGVLLSIGMLIASIIFTAILAAKVYRGGVLMYGKSATLKDIGKALSIHKGSNSKNVV
jgi:ABC-2 type transport system permease protein